MMIVHESPRAQRAAKHNFRRHQQRTKTREIQKRCNSAPFTNYLHYVP